MVSTWSKAKLVTTWSQSRPKSIPAGQKQTAKTKLTTAKGGTNTKGRPCSKQAASKTTTLTGTTNTALVMSSSKQTANKPTTSTGTTSTALVVSSSKQTASKPTTSTGTTNTTLAVSSPKQMANKPTTPMGTTSVALVTNPAPATNQNTTKVRRTTPCHGEQALTLFMQQPPMPGKDYKLIWDTTSGSTLRVGSYQVTHLSSSKIFRKHQMHSAYLLPPILELLTSLNSSITSSLLGNGTMALTDYGSLVIAPLTISTPQTLPLLKKRPSPSQ